MTPSKNYPNHLEMEYKKNEYKNFSVEMIPIYADNYTYAIHSKADGEIALVDPGEFDSVQKYLTEKNLKPARIFVTHVHSDHIGGVQKLLETYPEVEIYGSAEQAGEIPGIKHQLKEKDEISLNGFDFKVLSTPGHSMGDISFYNDEVIFSGDCLFMAGIGRVFTENYELMYDSLHNKIFKLPESTHVYGGHEYTENNIKFALEIEPDNKVLKGLEERVFILRSKGLATLPSAIGLEKMINPFFRLESPTVAASLNKKYGKQILSLRERFKLIRQWKDQF